MVGQVVVRLEDGRSFTADVVIGADGIWSKIRKQLIGETKANYSGYTCYTGACAQRSWMGITEERIVLKNGDEGGMRTARECWGPAIEGHPRAAAKSHGHVREGPVMRVARDQ